MCSNFSGSQHMCFLKIFVDILLHWFVFKVWFGWWLFLNVWPDVYGQLFWQEIQVYFGVLIVNILNKLIRMSLLSYIKVALWLSMTYSWTALVRHRPPEWVEIKPWKILEHRSKRTFGENVQVGGTHTPSFVCYSSFLLSITFLLNYQDLPYWTPRNKKNMLSTFIFSWEYKYWNMLSIQSLTHPCWSLPYRVAWAPDLPLGWTGRWGERRRQRCYSSLAPEAGKAQKVESRPAAFHNLKLNANVVSNLSNIHQHNELTYCKYVCSKSHRTLTWQILFHLAKCCLYFTAMLQLLTCQLAYQWEHLVKYELQCTSSCNKLT